MNRASLADQLAALKMNGQPGYSAPLTPSDPDDPVPDQRFKKSKKQLLPKRSPQGTTQLLHELPLWGTVASLQADRGFGFIARSSDRKGEVFFHFTARQPRKPVGADDLSNGDPIVFILGTEPRSPDKLRAVRWALVRDVDWGEAVPPHDQASLDALRREGLAAQPVKTLVKLMQAHWYTQLWKGRTAPNNLEDPVLQSVCIERSAALSPQELADFPTPRVEWMQKADAQCRQRLMQWYLLCRNGTVGLDWEEWFQARASYEAAVADFFIDQRIFRNDFVEAWIGKIIDQGRLAPQSLQRWVDGDLAATVRHFRHLPLTRQQDCFAQWRRNPSVLAALLQEDPSLPAQQLVLCGALALDLESDGDNIWEVGCSSDGQAHMLFAPGQGADLAAAMAQLKEHVSSRLLVVGHNILAWDWPIVSKHIDLPHTTLLWDTLLVQYLLEPQAQSHALGGTHHADADALAAAQLFEQQLKRLPAELAGALLTKQFKRAEELLDALTPLVENISCAREAPGWLRQQSVEDAVLVLPEHRLHEVDWVPGITVVSANPAEDLPLHLLQIDLESMELALQGEAGRHPAARVLMAVTRRCMTQHIALRFGMLAPWLLEGCPALEVAVRQACFIPRSTGGLRVAPLPREAQPMLDAGPSVFRLVGFSSNVLVFDQRPRALTQWADMARAHAAAPLLRLGTPQQGQVWLHADGSARVLSKRGRWRSFRTLVVGANLPTPAAEQPLKARPVLATRRKHVLHPGAMDQASYWAEVIRTVAEVTRNGHKSDGVHILLVGSTCSKALLELLRTGLAEIGLGEVQPLHRSRQAQLLRAARSHGVLVDLVEHWPQWQAIARFVGVALLPVVEALPLEQWFAAWSAGTAGADAPDAEADGGDGADEVTPETAAEGDGDEAEELPDTEEITSAPRTVVAPGHSTERVWSPGAGELLKETLRLTGRFLRTWLHESGLALAEHPAVLIDTRLARLGKELHQLVELLPLHGEPLSASQMRSLLYVLESLQIRREAAPSDYATMEQFLVANWQPTGSDKANPIRGFKETQKPAIQEICTRTNDVLVALPTGEGKSVLFQVPALCRGLRTRRLTLVLSPLKALMRDQLEGLRNLGFAESADYLSSDRPAHEVEEVIQGVLDHRIVLLYVAPERFRSGMFLDMLRQRVESDGTLEYAVVDETHCVNQWGYEFRPDYFHALQHLLENCRSDGQGGQAPFLLLSATITASDRERLQGILSSTAIAHEQPGLPLVVLPKEFAPPLRSHIEVLPRRVHGAINVRDTFEQVLTERLEVIVQCINDSRANQEKTGQRSAIIVFVTRRKHAEAVAQRIAEATACKVDYFHAGLDGATREETYHRFSEGEIDVLVATKAFGMGMDIPDIHWAIHLAPPAYLEDYLQEAGRIGRGQAQREKAGLHRLKAILLFSSEDFESIRSQRARGTVTLSTVKSLYSVICDAAENAGEQWMAIVPHEGFDPPDDPGVRRTRATQVRMQLYWLERAGKLALRSSVPNLLPVTLHQASLARIAGEEGQQGRLARVILDMEAISAYAPQQDVVTGTSGAREGWLGGLLSRLGDLAGLFLGKKELSANSPAARMSLNGPSRPVTRVAAASSGVDTAVINLGQIMLRCSFETLSDVMACLAELEGRGALSLQRKFEFSKRSLGSEPNEHIEALFHAVGQATHELARRLLRNGGIRFSPAELLEAFATPAVDPRKSAQYQTAFTRGVITLARLSGMRVRQVVGVNEAVCWEASLVRSAERRIDGQRNAILSIARAVFELLCSPECERERTVSMKELIEVSRAASPDGRFREAELKKALNLLSALQLVSLSVTMLPMSYVLTLDRLNDPLDHDQPLWDELQEINRLAELRNDAMEIFANLPGEAQQDFIEGYFSKTNAASLEKFLDTQLGDIDGQDDDGLSSFIREKREHLRATGVSEFFERYKQSEEPNQWAAMCHPYDEHLLVNAGPGAGKTAVLVGRIVHLIREQHIQPSDIVVLAFNRAVVFEIKKRIKELFRTLGYASYVKMLRVSTFHSFAKRELALADGGLEILEDREELLPTFVRRLSSDERLSKQVARGVRSILVDEFQDVTDDIYRIIHQLHRGSGGNAGVMVIGDDDQDILRWARYKKEFSETYFEKFRDGFGGDKLKNLFLQVNFRSGPEIVERSQKTISGFFEKNQYSKRIKDRPLRARNNEPVESKVHRISSRSQSWGWVLERARELCLQHVDVRQGSLAILCRSNAEVAIAHQTLATDLPYLAVQGKVNFRAADLRHVGLWLEFLEAEVQRQNRSLTPELKKELITAFKVKFDLPETRKPSIEDVGLEELWDLCCQEQAVSHLSDLMHFIRDLQTDELERLRGSLQAQPPAVVSTIHKVKGLEYDSVIMLPSFRSFGSIPADLQTLAMDAAEEARLLYVGMTRAKHCLTYFVGDREISWGSTEPRLFAGESTGATMLVGSHEDVGLGWSMFAGPFNRDPDGCQDYIEKEVRIGDTIVLGGSGAGAFKGFFHKGANDQLRQVGFLAKRHGAGSPQASLRVSAVVRFKPDPQNEDAVLANSVRQRGWGYVVLVSGQL